MVPQKPRRLKHTGQNTTGCYLYQSTESEPKFTAFKVWMQFKSVFAIAQRNIDYDIQALLLLTGMSRVSVFSKRVQLQQKYGLESNLSTVSLDYITVKRSKKCC